jgi:ATP-binding cassette, subfamily C (CFTR/MRP), member 1
MQDDRSGQQNRCVSLPSLQTNYVTDHSLSNHQKIPILLFTATQLALIVLWASPTNHPTTVSVPSAVLSLVVGFYLATLSYLEHTRSIRPSTIINLYLTFSILLDVAQCRTLWIRQANGIVVAAIFTTGLVAKAAMLVAEAVEKQSILDNPYALYPPEAIGGILNRSVFWWINSLLLRGSSTRLCLGDLFDLDVKLTSEHIEPRFQRARDTSSKTSSYSLLVTALKCFQFKILTIVVFRLCLIGFKFSQPLLIHRAVSLLDEPDSQEKSNVGRALIGATSLIYVGIAVTTGAFRHNVYRLITMVRSAIVGLIYRNTLSLDTKTANDSAALTLMSTDLESIASGIEVFDSLWAEPIEIGVAIYLLYDQIGVAFVAPIVTALGEYEHCSSSNDLGSICTSTDLAWGSLSLRPHCASRSLREGTETMARIHRTSRRHDRLGPFQHQRCQDDWSV